METNNKRVRAQRGSSSNKLSVIYSPALLSRKIILPMTSVANSAEKAIADYLQRNFEGRCVVEGYIKPKSVVIRTFSSGMLHAGNMVMFHVAFECEVSLPVEGMHLQCIAKNITKVGIRAVSASEDPSPIVVFISKDHHYTSAHAGLFHRVKEGDVIQVRVIGQRFELNDKFISIIAELVSTVEGAAKKKPRLVLRDSESPTQEVVLEAEVAVE